MSGKMHADEIAIDDALVRALISAQFPHWADLPIARVASDGTDNAMYRLGANKAVRLPRRPSAAAGQVEKEQAWLPLLAPRLPFPIPLPLGAGAPGEGYPWRWSVCRWIDGEIVTEADSENCELAADLARFVKALQQVDATGAPTPGAHNAGRGVALARRDKVTRAAIEALRSEIDADAALAAWEHALAAPAWDGGPVWIHGDLYAPNLLIKHGRLSAVLDFGCLGAGDPACDVVAAWDTFAGAARDAYRETLGVDEATWTRGRGWALSLAVVRLEYHRSRNAFMAANGRAMLAAVLADRGLA